MSMPFYVSPEQLMKDKADFARKGIARGRSVVVVGYEGGIVFAAENPSRALHKISEIYDRIAFAAAGKYNEFENLRVAGVRYADLRGYSYDRTDVTARALSNAYAQTMGTVFTSEPKPLEVEIVVAEVGDSPDTDQIYRLTYDGSVAEEHGYVVMGGAAEQVGTVLREGWQPDLTLAQALTLAVRGLSVDAAGGEPRRLGVEALEVAVLDRSRPRRAFRRIGPALLAELLASDDQDAALPGPAEEPPGPQPTQARSSGTREASADRPDGDDAPPEAPGGGATEGDPAG